MNSKGKKQSVNAKAKRAIKKSVAKAIADHARTGDPIVVWRKGRVTKISASRLVARE